MGYFTENIKEKRAFLIQSFQKPPSKSVWIFTWFLFSGLYLCLYFQFECYPCPTMRNQLFRSHRRKSFLPTMSGFIKLYENCWNNAHIPTDTTESFCLLRKSLSCQRLSLQCCFSGSMCSLQFPKLTALQSNFLWSSVTCSC